MDEIIDAVQIAIALLKRHEIYTATEKLNRAIDDMKTADFHGRQPRITVINVNIAKVNALKREICDELNKLPVDIVFDAKHKMMPVIDELCNGELSRLKTLKQKLSRPT